MVSDPKTPGVYVEEVSIFPPSVTSVATAIPAFLGYTEKAGGDVARITSMNEFVQKFGGPAVFWTTDGLALSAITPPKAEGSILFYCMQLYFANGGGPCYVASVGEFDAVVPAKSHFQTALANLKLEDEPTLLVMPDLRLVTTTGHFYDVQIEALGQCADLQDRFAVLDVFDDVDNFRSNIGSSNLKYGATYFPDLVTTIPVPFEAVATSTLTAATVAEAIETQEAAWLPIEKKVRELIAAVQITLPPSAAIAGVYAAVDRSRGVWKAPANVSLNAVLKPTIVITNEAQKDLNVPPNGKAVNAIRSFTGKGTLVWGARTLAGNDNEWRYVSVRRLFIMIEESIRKATEWVVFEPNDANTWLKVKTMIENYLFNLWKDGALAGAKASQAFFVKVGLNQTMTAQDILDGKLIVEVGLAAVRPAEFVILKFSHKLQES